MKKIFYISIVAALAFIACKKDPKPLPPYILNVVSPSYLSAVQKYVRQHPAIADYNSIDFEQYKVSKQKACWYLRLPIKNKALSTDFILLKTDSLGNTADGRIIHLEKALNKKIVNGKTITDHTSYNGSIDIKSFNGKTVIHSAITKGYIESFHPALFGTDSKTRPPLTPPTGGGQAKEESFPVPIDYDELPEMVVVGYTSAASSGGISVADYMMLESMFSGGGGGGGGSTSGGDAGAPGTGAYGGVDYGYGVYNPIDYSLPPTPSNGGGEETPQGVDPSVTLAFDESFFRPAIDLNAWMKCFTDIPDAGATSSITLYGDLPVDGDPSIGLNIWNGNTGHCFLQLSKTNGSQSVTQIIGFTAQRAGKAVLMPYAYIPSKIVDNAGHKYNCSITMNLTAAGLSTIIEQIKSQSDMPYSIVNYDCLDFALGVINSVRPSNPLFISKVADPNDPFSDIATGPKLYVLLQQMLENGSPESPNITVSGSKYIGASHGACN